VDVRSDGEMLETSVRPERMRIAIASTPVGPLGSGIGGGVELTLHSLVYGLADRGHHVEVIAPAGSLHVGERVHQIPGALQVSSQMAGRDAPVELPTGGVLAAMWDRIADIQEQFDVVVNMAYDWLPLYLTRFMEVPVVHLVSMGSLNDAMDQAVNDVALRFPGRLAAHSRAQAATFIDASAFEIVGNGIVPERYNFRASADAPPYLGFIGRISPEKGIDDVALLAERTGLPVRIWGMMQDPAYWQSVIDRHPMASLHYRGFLPTDDLQADIGGCTAIVMTPKWVEAFGNVAIEAMATGVPVIAYDRGGPAEIVVDGENGVLVPADDIDGLVAVVGRVRFIDRVACRRSVEERHSTTAFAVRIERWLQTVVDAHRTASWVG
jgi:UDP-glucose:tetrahydrobiopterin glucosyltransferase